MRALSLDVAPDAGVLSDGFRGERSCRRPPSTVRPGLPGETCTSQSAGQARITPLSAADCSLATFEHCIYVVSPVGGTFQQLKDSEGRTQFGKPAHPSTAPSPPESSLDRST
jgi:hypothetical protein